MRIYARPAGGASLKEGTSRGARGGQISQDKNGLELLANRFYLLMDGRKYLMCAAACLIRVCLVSANQTVSLHQVF